MRLAVQPSSATAYSSGRVTRLLLIKEPAAGPAVSFGPRQGPSRSGNPKASRVFCQPLLAHPVFPGSPRRCFRYLSAPAASREGGY
jgi:hypothetical protein